VRIADTDSSLRWRKILYHLRRGGEIRWGGQGDPRWHGQSQVTNKAGAVDTVITNALILDHWGTLFTADVGLTVGRIAAVGKAGNPDIQPNVTIVIGPAPR